MGRYVEHLGHEGDSYWLSRVSTDAQHLTAQRDALAALGVNAARVYVDHGWSGTIPGPARAQRGTSCLPVRQRLPASTGSSAAVALQHCADRLASRSGCFPRSAGDGFAGVFGVLPVGKDPGGDRVSGDASTFQAGRELLPSIRTVIQLRPALLGGIPALLEIFCLDTATCRISLGGVFCVPFVAIGLREK